MNEKILKEIKKLQSDKNLKKIVNKATKKQLDIINKYFK